MKILNLGDRIGKLVIKEEIKERDKWGHKRFHCICDCGNTHAVSASHLRRETITHCGCMKSFGAKHFQWKGVGEISGDYWYNHVIRSSLHIMFEGKGRKPKEISISIQEGWDLFLLQNRKCALSGLDLNFPLRGNDTNYNASLDRIDSLKGYVKGNIQWVHKHINIMKNKFDNDYFIEMCKLIAKNNETRWNSTKYN